MSMSTHMTATDKVRIEAERAARARCVAALPPLFGVKDARIRIAARALAAVMEEIGREDNNQGANMKLMPLGNRVVVKRSEDKTKTPGGIIIPETVEARPSRGEVLAVGRGRVLDDGSSNPPEVRPGDVVWFGRYSGTDLEIDGAKLLVLDADDVIGVEAP